ncbi:endonuclease/exonuclease/phosphatase family protein [Pseudonocardia abyssalis]|uniref:Endonuclease/exonuclease/phosphatase family protein n=1 Tax=Pseudonocardia abyssalis TaxID=2792008 RepID=A0ABS6UT40_9PSEU|nr:endonuclease/exonuclease/phosphatase family protein [Pseudonocardia abyssalis]MBW0114617.1 endonuclease/exonuclease/phosphatase family protein [Pseudonocardia abyssalis]MBW0135424.1 endonuclease/exonuclease/phosphatase family protein [Pseudonocardia abyssalis]
MAEQRERTPAVGGVAVTVLVAALPWAWFALRDTGPAADVVAIAMPLLAAGVVGVAGVVALVPGSRVRRGRAALFGLSTLLVAVVAIVGPWLPSPTGPVAGRGVTVLGGNVDYQDTPTPAMIDLGADVVVAAELAPDTEEDFGEEYPHTVVGGPENSPLGVFSRYPLRVLQDAGPDLPGMRVLVQGPGGPFVVYALHVPRPWFGGDPEDYEVSVPEHYALAAAVAGRVRAETMPVVLVGDLNSTDRGRDYRALTGGAGLSDVALEGWGGPTSVGKWLPLLGRIDHLLVSPSWCGDDGRRVELPGSSHRGVTATVGPCVGS